MLHESWLDKLRQPGAEPAERDNANALDKPSMLDKLHGAVAEQAARNADPYLRILTPVLPTDGTMISTNLIANYLGIKPTSGSGRRIARTMRSLGYFPLKSRTLLPGGWRGSEGRSLGPSYSTESRCRRSAGVTAFESTLSAFATPLFPPKEKQCIAAR